MKKKHILILHTDQQRYDSLGCTGNPYANTENIDALAEDGCNFTRHIATNPACMPSRASLMTGLYIPGHKVSSNGIPLWRRDTGLEKRDQDKSLLYFGENMHDKIPTLADHLGEQGYETALFGKLHLEPHLSDESYGFYESNEAWEKPDQDQRQAPYYGFQTHKIILGHGEDPMSPARGHYGRWLQENHPEYLGLSTTDGGDPAWQGTGRNDIYPSRIPEELHHSSWLADETCAYLEKNRDKEDPQFIFVGFPDPHHPFTPPEKLAEEFKDIPLPDFANIEDIKGKKPGAVEEAIKQFKNSKKDIALAYRYTSAMVKLIDKSVGRIIEKLKELKLYDDTIILFTSDHGDFLGDLDMLCKYDRAFNNLLHIPCIIKPAQAKPEENHPKVVDTAMSNADIFPTLLSLAGLEIPPWIQGVDIFSPHGKSNTPMVTAFSSRLEARNITLYDDRYRYTLYIDTAEEELYDHKEDPKELVNLAWNPSEENRNRCDKMKQALLTKHAECDLGIFNHYGLW